MRLAIIVSQFNKKISDRLLKGALRALKEENIPQDNIEVFEAPGAFEIPFFAQKLIDLKKFNGILALGCVLKGETNHYKAVCDGVTYGIQKVSVENRIPIMFGVLMCNFLDEALARSGENTKKNKGYECAKGLVDILGNL